MRLVSFGKALRRFAKREDGSVAVEAMIILPWMFWAFLVCFSIFDTFRMYNINQKAAYTVGDSVSRETAPLDTAYLNGMRQMFEYLAASPGQSTLRVSSLRWDEDDNRFYADWSQVSGNARPALTDQDVIGMTNRLPLMPDDERIILVESWTDYDPVFATGLEQQEITNFVFTRLRFTPNLCWESCPLDATL